MNTRFFNFNPATTKWDANNALALAHAADLAYADEPAVRTQLQQWGFDLTQFQLLTNTQTDTHGFIVGNEEMILVSFRGTEPEDIHNWMTDLDALLRPFEVGMVHRGFGEALDSVWPDIQAALARFTNTGQSLWFTGHSLGAALATLAVARCLFQAPHTPVNGLYTYGSPRAADFTFGRTFDQEFCDKTFRFVNNCDLVTRVPPRCLEFSHVGQLLYFDGDGFLQDDDHFWNVFLREVEVDFDSLKDVPLIIEDHGVEHYIQNLAKYIADVAAGQRPPLDC